MTSLPYLFLSPNAPKVILGDRILQHFTRTDEAIEISEFKAFPTSSHRYHTSIALLYIPTQICTI